MGDSRRQTQFTTFIKKNYPTEKWIIAVADGDCKLATKLATAGYYVIAIDPEIRYKVKHKHINYMKREFHRDFKIPRKIKLIVGLHPDEATAEIILAAEKNNIKWAVVPCCIKGVEAYGICNRTEWINKLRSLAKNIRETTLNIKGRNQVLYK